MKIKINHTGNKSIKNNLFESSQETQTYQDVSRDVVSRDDDTKIDAQKIQTVFAVASKQFVFDCGAIMGSIMYDTNNRFSLRYHALKAQSKDDFLFRVKQMIESTGEKLTANDISRLTNEYSKFISKQNNGK